MPSFMAAMSAITRILQARQKRHPIRGLTRLANIAHRTLPPYSGVVTLPDAIQMRLDSRISAERSLLFLGDYQPALTALLRDHTPPGAYCMDIGANLGFYGLKFARWAGTDGRVAAFEANPIMADRVQAHIALNQFQHVDVVQCAVHDSAGELEFFVSASPGKSSLHHQHVSDVAQTVKVQTITIDAYIAQQGWSRLDVMKLDIEGNDCRALLGAKQSLTQFRPFVAFEYWFSTPQVIVDELASLLSALDYTVEYLTFDGARQPCDWQPVDRLHHVDVLCSPAR